MFKNVGVVHDESMVCAPLAILCVSVALSLWPAIGLTFALSALFATIGVTGVVDDLLLGQLVAGRVTRTASALLRRLANRAAAPTGGME